MLLVPDKRGLRNIAGAVGLGLHTIAPALVRFGSVGPIIAAILLVGLLGHARRVGGATIAGDLRHPRRTLRMLLGA